MEVWENVPMVRFTGAKVNNSDCVNFTIHELLVMGLLKDREMHGLHIARSLAEKTGQNVPSGTGDVDPVIEGLMHKGFLSSRLSISRRRAYYSLTEAGRDRLSHIGKEWLPLVQALQRILPFSTAAKSRSKNARVRAANRSR
jgi:DNA-binding PadR family transcriptional regulator